MEPLNFIRNFQFNKFEKLIKYFFIFYLLMFGEKVLGQDHVSSEPKVDYLQRIYFSGENHKGLMTLINNTIVELNKKKPTSSLAAQFAFLMGIQERADKVGNACDVLDLLSVGIYDIDKIEAIKEGVQMPTDNAKENTVDVVENLSKISEVSKSFSNTTSDLTWSSYYLVNSGAFLGLSKIAGTTQMVSQIAGAASTAGKMAKSLGIKFNGKDKPCKGVPTKEIQIGEHKAPEVDVDLATFDNGEEQESQLTTVITITDLDFSSFRNLTDTLESHKVVHSFDKTFQDSMSTITVIHLGSTDELADWIYDRFDDRLNLVALEEGKISLASRDE
tara:strand:+ start:29553 stop:30548 length:996 start_codon:yes stop_codon:yes gene_type:complete